MRVSDVPVLVLMQVSIASVRKVRVVVCVRVQKRKYLNIIAMLCSDEAVRNDIKSANCVKPQVSHPHTRIPHLHLLPRLHIHIPHLPFLLLLLLLHHHFPPPLLCRPPLLHPTLLPSP